MWASAPTWGGAQPAFPFGVLQSAANLNYHHCRWQCILFYSGTAQAVTEEVFNRRRHLKFQFSIARSLGMMRPVRGLRVMGVAVTESGIQFRLNCWVWNRRRKTRSHFSTVSGENSSRKAIPARYSTFSGVKPKERV